MDIRKKLVEFLEVDLSGSDGYEPELIADYLIDHGVTVQEWISVDNRLPEDRGYYLVACRDKYNESTSIALDYYVICGAGEWWANEFTHNITHWMPLPQPPKGE